jgi:hypothetical protein
MVRTIRTEKTIDIRFISSFSPSKWLVESALQTLQNVDVSSPPLDDIK